MSSTLSAAIASWQGELAGRGADLLTPGEVVSAINDITIDTQVKPMDMPAAIYTLYLDASKRKVQGKENSREFSVAGVRRTLSQTLATLRTSV